jgi:hypothetical protein
MSGLAGCSSTALFSDVNATLREAELPGATSFKLTALGSGPRGGLDRDVLSIGFSESVDPNAVARAM